MDPHRITYSLRRTGLPSSNDLLSKGAMSDYSGRGQDNRHQTIFSVKRPGWQVPNYLLRKEVRLTGTKLLTQNRGQVDRYQTTYSERRSGWQVPSYLLRTEARLTGTKLLTQKGGQVDRHRNTYFLMKPCWPSSKEIRYKEANQDRMSSFVRGPGRPASKEILCKEANKQRMTYSIRRTSWSVRINFSVRRPMNTERLTL
jgi:hypothetical protein